MTLDLNKAGSTGPKKDYGRVPEGTFPARIAQVIDIGVQHQTDWQTQKPKYHVLDEDGKWAKKGDNFVFTDEPNDDPDIKPQVMFTFEFPTQRISIEKDDETLDLPRWMSKEFVFSNHEKAGLVKMINAIAPDTTKVSDLINKACLISVGTTSGGNAKITSIAAPVDGMTVGELENPPVVFSFDESDVGDFEGLANWIQNKIKGAVNFDKARFETQEPRQDDNREPDGDPNDDSDIPF